MSITSLAGRTGSFQMISALGAGTKTGAMTAIKAGFEANGWTVQTAGDNITNYALLCSPPVDSATPNIRGMFMWDSSVSAGANYSGHEQSGQLPNSTILFGYCVDGSAIADASALFDVTNPVGAVKWSGWNSIFGTATNHTSVDVWCSKEDFLVFFDNSNNFYACSAGASIKADQPLAGQTSTDSDGRVHTYYSSCNWTLINNMWTFEFQNAARMYLANYSSTRYTYYDENTQTWQPMCRRDQYENTFNPTDLAGGYVREDIAIVNMNNWCVVGRLRNLHPIKSLYCGHAQDNVTGDDLGISWGPSNTTLVEGILAAST